MRVVLLAALIAFPPALLIGWLLDAWLSALAAGVVVFLLLWPVAAGMEWTAGRIVKLTSSALTFPRDP